MASDETPGIREVFSGARSILAHAGFSEQFTVLRARRTRAMRRRPSIVIVGEVSTGKSTLVNALLSRPQLSPTGDGETTGTYVRFTAPHAELRAGTARIQFLNGGWREIAQEDLARWILVGAPELIDDEGRMSLGAVVAAESPSLPGVDLIDTPGTGGLSAAHARVAINAAEQASVLLLVTDASGRLARPALDLLAQCAGHVDTIAVAVSRIDLVGPEWELVAEENGRILVAEDPGYADIPVIGVSALAALQALDARDDTRRERRRATSRIDVLLAALRSCLDSSRNAPDRRALNDIDRLLQVVENDLDAQLGAQRTGNDGVDERLQTGVARLRDLDARRRTWRAFLQRDLRRARQEVSSEITTRVGAMVREAQTELARKRMGVSKEGLHRFMLDLHAQSALVIDDCAGIMHARITTVVRDTFVSHGLTDISAEILADWERLSTPGRESLPDALNGGGVLDPQLLLSGFFTGNMVFSLMARTGVAGGMAIAGAAALPVAIVAGIGMFAVNLVARDATTRRQELQGLVRETGQRLTAELHKLFDSYTIEFQPEIEISFEQELTRVIRELNLELGQLQQSMKASAEERADTIAEIEHRLGLVRAQRAKGHALILQMASASFGNIPPAATLQPGNTPHPAK